MVDSTRSGRRGDAHNEAAGCARAVALEGEWVLAVQEIDSVQEIVRWAEDGGEERVEVGDDRGLRVGSVVHRRRRPLLGESLEHGMGRGIWLVWPAVPAPPAARAAPPFVGLGGVARA
jgi:hypothetical protein